MSEEVRKNIDKITLSFMKTLQENKKILHDVPGGVDILIYSVANFVSIALNLTARSIAVQEEIDPIEVRNNLLKHFAEVLLNASKHQEDILLNGVGEEMENEDGQSNVSNLN